MNRRNFLAAIGVSAFAVATGLARTSVEIVEAARRYVLYGDGITDDTEAIQAAMDGADVWRLDGSLVASAGVVEMRGGERIFLTRSIRITQPGRIDGRGCSFVYRGNGGPVFSVERPEGVAIQEMYLEPTQS